MSSFFANLLDKLNEDFGKIQALMIVMMERNHIKVWIW
jgi:hypothetical protein